MTQNTSLLEHLPGGTEALMAYEKSPRIREDLKRARIWRPGLLLRPLYKVREDTGRMPRVDRFVAWLVKLARHPYDPEGRPIRSITGYLIGILRKDYRAIPEDKYILEVASARKTPPLRRGDPHGRTFDDRYPMPQTIGELLKEEMKDIEERA